MSRPENFKDYKKPEDCIHHAQFASGEVPMDEPPGLLEREYKRWLEMGGKVEGLPSPEPKQQEEPAQWAIVELMGHVKLAGRLTEVERFGCKLGRLDIPEGDGFVTRLFGGQSVYSITYVTEAVARHVRKQTTAAPVSPWDFPKQLPAPPTPDRTCADCGQVIEECECEIESEDEDGVPY